MKLKSVLLAAVGLAAPGSPPAAGPEAPVPGCSRQAVAAAGTAVRETRAALRAAPLGEMGAPLSAATSGRIERAKDRVVALVSAEMACAPPSPPLEALTAAMMADGDGIAADAPSDPLDPRPGGHGGFLSYEAIRVEGHPDLLAVVARLGIECGSDSMLMLYRRSHAGWRQTMVLRSAPYREVSGGWDDLRFAVSPADAQGNWFVATVSTTPWCTSAWQGMPYQLARLGPAPDRPDIFFRGRNTIYLGHESDLSLKVGSDSVEIRHDGSSLDPSILVRRHVRRYAVSGGAVRRVPPVAESVRDFVDEWIVSPWAEAEGWSASDPGLARLHAQLHDGRYELLGEFTSIRACGEGITQVEIGGEPGPNWYFLAKGGESGPWTLERVARRAGAGCTGPDRLKPGPG